MPIAFHFYNREANVSELSDRELFLLSEKVASYLMAPNGQAWRAWPNSRLRRIDMTRNEFTLAIWAPPGTGGRIKIAGIIAGDSGPQIMIRPISASAMAVEIERRLLPRYYQALAQIRAENQANDNLRARVRQIADDLVATGRGLVDLPPSRHELNGKSIELLNGPIGIRVEGIVKQSEVSLKMAGLAPDLARDLLALIANRVAPISNEGDSEC
jgi:hypothetical protein